METYLHTPIKEVITKFPKVGQILEEYEIGCVPCSLGSCLLKDIIEIHNLSEEDEQVVMARIAKEIYPDREMKIPKIPRKPRSRTKELKYSPPMKKLVDEHVLIKKWIALIPQVLETFDLGSAEDRELILEGVNFIRSYADRFHHAKEEDILFKYFDENSDILKTMLEDHAKGRNLVKAIVEALEKRDRQGVVGHLLAYRGLLTEHIKKEDEILYPWMDRNFTVTQVGELFSKFNEVEGQTDRKGIERCETFVFEVEKKFRKEVTQ
jgi:hemerythrin-like domain-containing protein